MLNKKIKAMLFIFLIFFCISAANAASNDTISIDDSANIVDVKSDSYIAVIEDTQADTIGNFSSLNKSINSLDNNQKLQLNHSYTYNKSSDSKFSGGINITKNVTIDGQGYTISGNNAARIFNVFAGVNLILKNIKLINGNTTNNGGAIFVAGSNNNINITLINVTLSNNTGKTGAAVRIESGNTNVNLTIINSTFIDNKASSHGGAFSAASGSVKIENSAFISNTAVGNGGAVSATTLTVSNSTFTGNVAKGNGGAIVLNTNGKLDLTNSNFTNNNAGNGSAVYSTKGDVNLTNSNFKNNNATLGGAIYCNGTLNIVESNFINNTASSNGGAISSNGTLNIVDSTFYDNSAKEQGGAIYSSLGDMTVTNSTFVRNNASKNGGAIRMELKGDNLTVVNSKFIDNVAGTHAGAISNSNITVINSTFTGNTATGGNGGALSGTDLTVVNSTFTDNKANKTGGAIVVNNGGIMTVENSTFSGNNADNGTAIYNNNGTVDIADSRFEGNNGTQGAVYNNNGTLTVDNSEFTGNNATNGGAIFSTTGNLTVNNTKFSENVADNGGAIYTTDSNVTLDNSEFTGNHATNGGAIYTADSNVTVDNSQFTGNNATNGGAIYTVDSNVTVDNSEFTGNNATNGGAIFGEDSNVTVDSSKFAENIADNGGAIYYANVTESPDVALNVANSDFTENSGKLGDDIFTTYSTTVSNNNYTQGSFANIYVNNTVINGTVISVLRNTTYYVTAGSEYKVYALATVDGATVGGYNITITDENGNYSTVYKGEGIYETENNFTANFMDKAVYSAFLNDDQEMTIEIHNGTVQYKQNITVNVTVSDVLDKSNITGNITLQYEDGTVANITGQVTVEIDGKNYTVDVVNGKGSFSFECDLNPGNYTLTAKFDGDEYYNPATASANFTVEETTIILETNNLTKYYGNDGKLIIVLVDSRGNPLVNQEITIEINGVIYTRTTDENGTIAMGINLDPGVYTASVSYGNLTENATVTILSTIEASDIVKYYRNGTQYIATFYDVDGKPLANTNVTFNINGVFYTRTTDENGTARLNINLNPGEYIITALNPANNQTYSNNVTVLSSIVAEDVVKYYRNGTQYHAIFKDLDGNPLANTNVTFNINGVFYTRTTDENGVATLNINLNPEEYIITAFNPVNNQTYSNLITVLSVIETEDIVMSSSQRQPFTAKILGEHGEALAGVTVRFNINGMIYEKTTNEEGIAVLQINLIAGEYLITTTYNDLNVANLIIIM